jgi:hypothetical protein
MLPSFVVSGSYWENLKFYWLCITWLRDWFPSSVRSRSVGFVFMLGGSLFLMMPVRGSTLPATEFCPYKDSLIELSLIKAGAFVDCYSFVVSFTRGLFLVRPFSVLRLLIY